MPITVANSVAPAASEPLQAGPEPQDTAPQAGTPSREALIREHAYALYVRSGGIDGCALEHWLIAEAELGAEAAADPGPHGVAAS